MYIASTLVVLTSELDVECVAEAARLDMAAGRADYFGQAVNRAARLREAAPPGQVRLPTAAR